jgi:hypothetical protein
MAKPQASHSSILLFLEKQFLVMTDPYTYEYLIYQWDSRRSAAASLMELGSQQYRSFFF